MCRFRIVLLYLLAACVMLLGGCGSGEGVTATLPPASTPNPTAASTSSQGTLRLAMPSQIATWHPLRATQREVRSLLGLIYEPLVETGEDGAPEGALAQSWTVDENSRTWTLRLRQNVTWHDGAAFNAQDVIYTLDMLQKIGENSELDSPYVARLDWLESWSAPDDATIVLVTKEPYYGILHALDFPILYRNSGMTASSDPMQLIGTGPYRLDALNRESMSLTAQDAWWKKRPSIEKIQVNAYSDTQSALAALYLQQLDAVQTDTVTLDSYEYIQSVQVYSYVTPYFYFLAYNLSSNKVSTPTMRQAIAYGIDRSALISDVYVGAAIQVDVPIMPNSWLYDGRLLTYGYQPGLTRATLEKVGWRKQNTSDTYYNISPGGITGDFVLRLLVSDGEDGYRRQEVARLIQNQLKDVGIKVEILVKTPEEYQSALSAGEYDIALGGWYLSQIPDLSAMLRSDGALNPNGYNSGAMDSLLDNAKNQLTADGLKEATDAICDLLLQDLPWMSLYFESHALVIGDHLTGITAASEANAYQSIENWNFIS